MNHSEDLEIQVEETAGGIVVRPIGDIDLGRAPSLRTRMASIQSNGPPLVVVDLASVPYMDSSGVATLVEAMQVARRSGGKLILCALQDKVRSIFEIARLDMVFTIVASTDDALES